MKWGIIQMLSILVWISNCTIATPFQKNDRLKLSDLKKQTLVVVAITEVEIKGSFSLRSIFWNRVSSVRSSLAENEGYLGGAIRRELFGNRAWTMTVWKDEISLDRFVESVEHERAMREGGPAVTKSKFYRGYKQWQEIPLSWETAEKIMEEEARVE